MSTHYDVAIVGAGVAGNCAAISLSKRGARVAIFDSQVPGRAKVCGEFLSPEVRSVFKRLNVADEIETQAREVSSARIVCKNQKLSLPLSQSGWALSRQQLDSILWQATQNSGADCFLQTTVRNLEHRESLWTFEANGERQSAQFIVLATGRNSRLGHNEITTSVSTRNQRYIGFKAHFRGACLPAGVVELHPFEGGYCGLVRIENDLTNVCLLARYDVVQKQSPEVFFAWLLQNVPSLRSRLEGAELCGKWLATANVQFETAQPSRAGLLFCGDAAGYIHPLSGDGMAMAARSGELAAACIHANLHNKNCDASELYNLSWKREFSRRLNWASRFQPLLLSPSLANAAIRVLKRIPKLAQHAVTLTRG